jgi:uncharacterized membrane protein YGL010W
MKSFNEQVLAYSAYHRDARNKLTHFFGVPMVTFALFVALGWLRVVEGPVPVTGATLFYLTVFLYYLVLDWRVALLQAPFTLGLLVLADWVSQLPVAESGLIFLVAFIGGWIVQLAGHAIEGRRPALADNILQIFNAPLFLVVEVLLLLGFRKELGGLAIKHQKNHGDAVNIDGQGMDQTAAHGV